MTLKEVKEWLEISSTPVKPVDNSVDRISKIEENTELLQAEVLELKNLIKVLAKEVNDSKSLKLANLTFEYLEIYLSMCEWSLQGKILNIHSSSSIADE